MPSTQHDSPSSPASSWLAIVIRSLISLALLGGSVAFLFAFGRGTPPPAKPLDETRPLVQVERVTPHTGGINFQVDGVVIPFREIEVPTEVGGRIAFKSENCRVGHTVSKGELLVRIDPLEYELEVRRINENVRQAQVQLQELAVQVGARKRQIELAEEDLTIKRREFERYQKIDDPGVYSQSELDTARLKELQARDAVQTEQDQLELLEASRSRLEAAIDLGLAQRDKANLDLKRTDIHAPINGIVTREGPEQGGFLQRGSTVAFVQDSSLMEIRCSLPMRQMNWLWQRSTSEEPPVDPRNVYQLPETPATVRFDIGSATCSWSGRLAYYDGGQVDQQTRMVPCRVVVDRPDQVEISGEAAAALTSAPVTLLTGMYVNVEIHANPGMQLLQVPEKAIQPGNHVWSVTRDEASKTAGMLHRQKVNVAHSTDDMVLVYPYGSDLKIGDLVVVSPLSSPTESAGVEVMEQP